MWARELHDVVAHRLAPANARAGTATHLAHSHPDQVRRILTDLAGTTSSALRELKATVGLLRCTDDPEPPSAPSPGLGQLAEGMPRPLKPGVDLTAHRIVRERAEGRGHGAVATPADECDMRWTCRYVILCTGDEPTHVGIFGYSGD